MSTTSSSSSSSKKVTLRSSDGKAFEVDEVVALESQTIKYMIEDDCVDNAIPLPNVTAQILSKVIEFCKKHVKAKSSSEDATVLKDWDAEFVKVDENTLFELDLTCQTVRRHDQREDTRADKEYL